MKIDIFKHTIVNTVKSVSFGMKKPEKKILEQDKNETVSSEKMYKKIKSFLKEKTLKFNRNSITIFLAYYIQFIRKIKFYFSLIFYFGKTTIKPGINGQPSFF